MVALGYVVFFRTVTASELPVERIGNYNYNVVFEEPDPPLEVGEEQHAPSDPPLVAIIIDDMGYHNDVGVNLLSLPLALTFSFLPYAPFTAELEELAYQQGNTVMLHQPMQPKDDEWDPGSGALLVTSSRDEHDELFQTNLLRVPHATGVNNHMGSLYTEYPVVMAELLLQIKNKDLFFVDSFTSSKSVGYKTAIEIGVKSTRRHVFLDNVHSVDKICAQLEKLVELAEKQGKAVGIGHPFKETYEALKKCTPQYLERIKIVSVSELVE